jgi:hypothetical protein
MCCLGGRIEKWAVPEFLLRRNAETLYFQNGRGLFSIERQYIFAGKWLFPLSARAGLP